MINVKQAKEKLGSNLAGITPKIKKEIEKILDSKLVLEPKTKDQVELLKWIEGRLAAPHLGYLDAGQVNGVWGSSLTEALFELCSNYYVLVNKKNPAIGQSTMLCILDGSIPSKKISLTLPPKGGEPLSVPYYSQRDSKTGHSYRMCFSSSCSMLLEYKKPGTLKGANGDDQYLERVFNYGDTVDALAQVKALRSYGLNVQFRTDLNLEMMDRILEGGNPLPIGILHQGPIASPRGFGHWIIVIGKTSDGKHYWVHDPYGTLDMKSGQYISTEGKKIKYSVEGIKARWTVNGAGGWGMVAI
jgi:hypothetical protein